MEIREYKKEDAKELLNLFNKCFNYDYKVIDMEPTGVIYVVVIDNKIVGMATIDILNDIFKNINYGYVNNVCIDPDYQGQGLSKKLMNKILEYGISNDLEYIMLTSNKKRIAAHGLYKSMGYEIVDTCLFKKYIK